VAERWGAALGGLLEDFVGGETVTHDDTGVDPEPNSLGGPVLNISLSARACHDRHRREGSIGQDMDSECRGRGWVEGYVADWNGHCFGFSAVLDD